MLDGDIQPEPSHACVPFAQVAVLALERRPTSGVAGGRGKWLESIGLAWVGPGALGWVFEERGLLAVNNSGVSSLSFFRGVLVGLPHGP